MKRKIAILGVFVVCISLFLTGGKPKLVGEDAAKEAGLAMINQVFDVSETEAEVTYQEQTGATFIDGNYQVTGKEQLSQFFYDKGCKVAFNLDGGRSSEMVFLGKTINRPYDGGRATTDILMIVEE